MKTKKLHFHNIETASVDPPLEKQFGGTSFTLLGTYTVRGPECPKMTEISIRANFWSPSLRPLERAGGSQT